MTTNIDFIKGKKYLLDNKIEVTLITIDENVVFGRIRLEANNEQRETPLFRLTEIPLSKDFKYKVLGVKNMDSYVKIVGLPDMCFQEVNENVSVSVACRRLDGVGGVFLTSAKMLSKVG